MNKNRSTEWQAAVEITNREAQHRERMRAEEIERLENEATDKNASPLSRSQARTELAKA